MNKETWKLLDRGARRDRDYDGLAFIEAKKHGLHFSYTEMNGSEPFKMTGELHWSRSPRPLRAQAADHMAQSMKYVHLVVTGGTPHDTPIGKHMVVAAHRSLEHAVALRERHLEASRLSAQRKDAAVRLWHAIHGP
jgi:hypothetical protein